VLKGGQTTLGQDIEFRQGSGLFRDVGVPDSRLKGLHTDRHCLRLRNRKTQPGHRGTDTALHGTERSDGDLNVGDCRCRIFLRSDVLGADAQTLGIDGRGQPKRDISHARRCVRCCVTNKDRPGVEVRIAGFETGGRRVPGDFRKHRLERGG
jgi:hypothetical protein